MALGFARTKGKRASAGFFGRLGEANRALASRFKSSSNEMAQKRRLAFFLERENNSRRLAGLGPLNSDQFLMMKHEEAELMQAREILEHVKAAEWEQKLAHMDALQRMRVNQVMEKQAVEKSRQILIQILKKNLGLGGRISPVGERAIYLVANELAKNINYSVLLNLESKDIQKVLNSSVAFKKIVSELGSNKPINLNLREEAAQEINELLERVAEEGGD